MVDRLFRPGKCDSFDVDVISVGTIVRKRKRLIKLSLEDLCIRWTLFIAIDPVSHRR